MTHPDKFGLLINVKEKMDKLNKVQLYNYADSVFQILSMAQLKDVLFVGLNKIKNNIEYDQLFQVKASINKIIEKEERLKNKHKQKTKIKTKTVVTVPFVAKNASLTATLPFDIISNNICTFLGMPSMTKLVRCDRKLAIICHSPSSIKSVLELYNMNRWKVSEIHRFSHVERLAIDVTILNRLKIFNFFQRVKHLSFYNMKKIVASSNASRFSTVRLGHEYNLSEMELMPLLQTITFRSVDELLLLLSFLGQYKTPSCLRNGTGTDYYNKIIYNLQSIAFVNCYLVPGHGQTKHIYPVAGSQNMVHFILQLQTNNLEILKFENSVCYSELTKAHDEFGNIDRIKSSLSNLKGFVYSEEELENARENEPCVFYKLAKHILSNLIAFKKLQSLHTHSSYGLLLSSYLNNNNKNALNKISELCISIENVADKILKNLSTLVPNLEKLCVVFKVSQGQELIESILKNQTKLKLFQIVTQLPLDNYNDTGDDNDDSADICFCETLIKAFCGSESQTKQPLVFKFYVNRRSRYRSRYSFSESVDLFEDVIPKLIMTYLTAYPYGKIQFKLSYKPEDYMVSLLIFGDFLDSWMKKLNGKFKIVVKKEDRYDSKYATYGISATNYKNISEENINHEKKWKVDCRYCCNTPWV